MDVMSGIVVYFTLWWIVFFMALPFGTQPPTVTEEGHQHGAPHRTYLPLKVLLTTAIAIALWVGVDYLISIDFINFREMGYDL